MNRSIFFCCCLAGAFAVGFAGSAVTTRPPTTDKRMDAVLGRVFIVDNVEYISARKYHVADHVVCVGQGQRELILHVAAIENITHLNQEAKQ